MASNSEKMSTYRLPGSASEDLAGLRRAIESFKAGSVSAPQLRALRVPMGVYEQREEGTFMLRLRVPAGGVLPHQMRALAAVARKYGDGVLHVTTRQDIQVHRVMLDDVHAALVELDGAGLSTKGGGGNTVRNITACPDAGVCAREVFDVAPYSIAVTEFLVADPLSFQLPRKFKLAFSGCPRDCAGARINDLGFVAKRSGGTFGFEVYAGGGMGARSRVGALLEEFVPQDEVHLIAEAIKRVFDKHGNRKNRSKARLRFLIEQIGAERFRELYAEELQRLRKDGLPALQTRDIPRRGHSASETPAPPGSEEFDLWRRRSVVPQKQHGYSLAWIPLPLGDIASDALEKLAELVEKHGEGMVRTTQSQNLVVRWLREDELTSFHQELAGLGLATPIPAVQRNLVSCAGASTCKLGICLSRGLARAILETLSRDGIDLDGLGELNLHISGCPNSCGRHPIASLGLYGIARRIGGRLVPHYVVQLGGGTSGGKTTLAEGTEAIPARNVPAFTADFLRAFQASREYPDYEAFLKAGGREIAKRLASARRRVPPFEEDKNCYFDWGAETPFSLAGRGAGECGAGVFDLIEDDLTNSRVALREGNLPAATALAARALLVTQGQEARNDADALRLFARHFLDTHLVNDSFRGLIERAQARAVASGQAASLAASADEISAFIAAVQALYDRMDPSLRFQSATADGGVRQPHASAQPEAVASPAVKADREADFHGVACPLNYVKTKLLLEPMQKGQVLSVLLNPEGARNVPASVERDGHSVLSLKQEGAHWRVLIRKS